MKKHYYHCALCGEECVSSRHDVLKKYVCGKCLQQKGYSVTNTYRIGKVCTLPSFSVEFEIASPEPAQVRRALILLGYHFARCYDATVSDEYKSPIYENLRAFRKPLAALHELRDLVNEQCGTHLHCAFTYRRELYGVRDAVFGPLIDYLGVHPEQTVAFWGRMFCDQARPKLLEGERHVSFNLWTHHQTIEYRLPRFRTAPQYLAVVQFCRSTTAFLNDYFYARAEQRKGTSRTPEQLGEQLLLRYQDAARRACSQETSRKENTAVCAD